MAIDAARGKTLFGSGIEGTEQSESVSSLVDEEVKKIITRAYEKAESVMIEHRKALDAIARQLIEMETIEQGDFEHILITNGIMPKKKQDIEHQPLA